MNIKKQFWIDLVVVVLIVSISQIFEEKKADEIVLALQYIFIFGGMCMYRIMSFLDECKKKAEEVAEVLSGEDDG